MHVVCSRQHLSGAKRMCVCCAPSFGFEADGLCRLLAVLVSDAFVLEMYINLKVCMRPKKDSISSVCECALHQTDFCLGGCRALRPSFARLVWYRHALTQAQRVPAEVEKLLTASSVGGFALVCLRLSTAWERKTLGFLCRNHGELFRPTQKGHLIITEAHLPALPPTAIYEQRMSPRFSFGLRGESRHT